MTRPLDRKRTLDELDPPAWGPPSHDSYLVTTCHRLRTRPIGTLGVEDLRILIGQQIGLPWLVPLALEMVEANPLSEGDYYPGDLLNNLLQVSPDFWQRERGWRARLVAVLAGMESVPAELSEAVAAFQEGTI